LGYFNLQTEVYERTLDPEFDKVWSKVTWKEVIPTNRPCLMIRTTYLRQNMFPHADQVTLRNWLAAGKVRAVAGAPDDPFPDVIETGEPIPAGQDMELGHRILFMLDW